MKAQSIVSTLKKLLKQKGISYKQVAIALNLSESRVKRLFSERDFTLGRLEVICQLIDIDFYQLVKMHETIDDKIKCLSVKQEQLLVENPVLILLSICISTEMSFDEIAETYQLNRADLKQSLSILDRLGIIDFLPNHRYRLRVSRQFRWIPNGPIYKFAMNTVLSRYLTQVMSIEARHMQLKWGILSQASQQQVLKKIERLVEDYMELEELDTKLPLAQKQTSSLFLLFSENWSPEQLKALLGLDMETAR